MDTDFEAVNRIFDELKALNDADGVDADLLSGESAANNVDGKKKKKGEAKKKRKSVASAVVKFAMERVELFHDINRDCYAINSQTGEVWRLDGSAFADWIRAEFFAVAERSAPDSSLKEAVSTLSGVARFRSGRQPVSVRCAKAEGSYYVDLAEAGSGRAIKVSSSGWSVVEKPDVRFVRYSPMQPLPVPVSGGAIRELWNFVNVPEPSRLLVLTWLLDCLRPDSPFPVLELIGEHGSAKSSCQTFLRRLIDPNTADLRALSKNAEDIFVAAGSQWIVSFENVTHIAPYMQDALCILATGGGFAKRKLFSDADEAVISVKRPVALNSINASITAQDLLDRAISVELPNVMDRKEIEALTEKFEAARPALLGALLDLMVKALRVLPAVAIPKERRPRLIEFARLGVAVARSMELKDEHFFEAFTASRQEAIARTIDASPVATAVISWLENNPAGIRGVAGSIFRTVETFKPIGCDSWPRTAKGFADALRRAAPALRQMGVECRREDDHQVQGGGHEWSIKKKQVNKYSGHDISDITQVSGNGGVGPQSGDLGEVGDIESGDFVDQKCPRCDGEGCQSCEP